MCNLKNQASIVYCCLSVGRSNGIIS